MIPGFFYDEHLVAEIAARFDLRRPNAEALDCVVKRLAGEYDPAVPQILDLATATGKTYIMAALVEYLRELGIRDVLLVTPTSIVQSKTVANFTLGDPKYISGSLSNPFVVTPEDYDLWKPGRAHASLFSNAEIPVQLFILNVQQMIAPKTSTGTTTGGKKEAQQRAFRTPRESSGKLNEYLRSLDNLVIITDEHHLYSDSAQVFQSAIRELDAAAVIGLTASSDKNDEVIYRYSLREAIQEGYVKRPIIAFRKGGYGDNEEEQQLRDALVLLETKRQHYENYQRMNPEVPKIHPVLYVQCVDVSHASEIAALLRGPEYFGSTDSVLQVDNQHSDALTLKRLRNLDDGESTVRCVVSVNKLREGWDVKNVAVMVTLRTMASDVLTQQTLGRGLRLPFGRRTGIAHVDQLDILAHGSFRKYLTSEGVLKTFGLESILADEAEKPHPTEEAQQDLNLEPKEQAATEAQNEPDDGLGGTSSIESSAGSDHIEVTTLGGGAVDIVVIDDDAELRVEQLPKPVTIQLNEQFANEKFLFPATSMTRETAPFSLARIDDVELRMAAHKISDQGGVLSREAIVFKGKRVVTRDEEDVRVGSIKVDSSQATTDLIRSVMRSRYFDSSDVTNLALLKKHTVPLLIAESGITEWTTKALESAMVQLNRVISNAATKHVASMGTTTTIHPRPLPIASEYELPIGRTVLDLLDSNSRGSGFQAREHYGPWSKGLFDAASFDSFSTEYRIAMLLNRSADIIWWKRLYKEDQAKIAYTLENDYYPDFVALDQSGYHWIIEGKSEAGRDDASVAAKRKAAEEAVRMITAHPQFEEQKWGYSIAYESDVKVAESWNDLLVATRPVKTYA